MKLIIILITLFIISLANTSFAQVGKVEIDSTRGDTLVTLTSSIPLLVMNSHSIAISLDFDKYSNGSPLYAFVIKVQTDKVLSFIEKDSCNILLNDKVGVTLKSVYVDGFQDKDKYSNWIHFDFPANLLRLLQDLKSLDLRLYNLGKLYEARMRNEDIEKFNKYMKEYIIKN